MTLNSIAPKTILVLQQFELPQNQFLLLLGLQFQLIDLLFQLPLFLDKEIIKIRIEWEVWSVRFANR